MKRFSLLMLSILLLFSLSSCGGSDSATSVCPSCSSEQSADASFCQNCGTQISTNRTCGSCGAEAPFGASFCSSCGSSLNGSAVANTVGDSSADISSDQSSSASQEGASGTSDCSICAYEGLDVCKGHSCWTCDGRGYIKCYGCVNGNTAYGPCIVCEGGKIDCPCDNGTKYYDRPIQMPTAYETCSNCENGYVTCPLCDGSGTFGTTTVGGFDGKGKEIPKTCSKCFGGKKVRCPSC